MVIRAAFKTNLFVERVVSFNGWLAVMSTVTRTDIAVLLLLCCCTVSAQVSSSAPKHWKSGSPVGLGSSGFEFSLKLGEILRGEILDTNTVRLIAESVQLSEHERTLFLVAPDCISQDVWVYTLGDEWSEGCGRFAERLNAYVLARMDGHTRACLLAGLTNRMAIAAISDPDLRILSTNYPLLPVWLFHKAETGTTTNRAGKVASLSMTTTVVDGKLQFRTNSMHIPEFDEVCRWASYTLVDGDIGWRFVLRFAVNGALADVDTSKFDARELDPRFRKVMQEVDAEVTAEMKQEGMLGKLGSVHIYWQLKQEKLKARGIDWRSPAKLNQGCYD